jgi:hypothetical protein
LAAAVAVGYNIRLQTSRRNDGTKEISTKGDYRYNDSSG